MNVLALVAKVNFCSKFVLNWVETCQQEGLLRSYDTCLHHCYERTHHLLKNVHLSVIYNEYLMSVPTHITAICLSAMY